MPTPSRRALTVSLLALALAPQLVRANDTPWTISVGVTNIDVTRYLDLPTGWDARTFGFNRRGPSLSVSRDLPGNWSVRLLHEQVDHLFGINRCPNNPGLACLAVVFPGEYKLDATEFTVAKTFRADASLQPMFHLGFQRASFHADNSLPDYKEIEWVGGVGLAYAMSARTRLSLEWQKSGAEIETIRASFGFKF
ncbi:hypothetical protein C7S18_19720 [Ahniella affigens]|uniref:Outer membrane protein beta-barrel domain-containing protein n=1 Tax=Ahniella affigens TaxID=2021234 RepID=A0A2P1PWL3_9GAMM|nr:hypothetical protein [Ahniella affigens]AVP99255.1 hypothetical protein C7S18_19720 [Ahniella affigens]